MSAPVNQRDLKGKVALVAGGAKNLGALVALQLADLGAKVVIHYHSDAAKKQAEDVAAQIKSKGSDAIIIQGDLTKVANIENLFAAAKNHFGGIDIAINTVGQVLKKPIANISEEEFDTIFDINSKVAFFFIQKAGQYVFLCSCINSTEIFCF